MSPFGFQALSHAWAFALLAPLILFYFLKLKRPRLEVPSLFLWRRVLSDNRVNSPFQRFKRNLLLLVQILLLSLLGLAGMLPFFRGRAARAERLPILVDASASMAALDRSGGRSRLDEAKDRVRRRIEGMLPDQEIAILSFGRTVRKRAGFTSNKRILREALDAVSAEDVQSDIEDALQMTRDLGRSAPFSEALLLSDGNLPASIPFDLSFKLDFQRLPPAGQNVGITALSARRRPDEAWDVLLLVEGSAAAEGPATVEISRGGNLLATESVSIRKGRPERMTFRVPGDRPASLEVRLSPDGFDALASDNAAWLDLPALRPLRAFCPPSLPICRQALRAIPGVRLAPEGGEEAAQGPFDLVVTDRERDAPIEASVRLTLGFVPPDAGRLLSLSDAACEVVDWRRHHALLAHVELGDLLVLGTPVSREGISEGDYENAGFEVLAHGPRGPLLLERREPGRVRYHLLFHPDRSTLPYRIAFPILLSNLASIAREQAGLSEVRGARTGVLPPLAVSRKAACRVEGPAGLSLAREASEDGTLAGVPAPSAGVYRVFAGGSERARIGASLLSASESALEGVDKIRFNEEVSVSAAAGPLEADRSLWLPLAALAFLLLLAEWWLFQRRPAGVRG